MIRFQIPVFLAIAALNCAAVKPSLGPVCVTKCGLTAYEGDCAALQAFETRALARLERAVPALKADKTCAALPHFRLVIRRHQWFLDNACDDQAWLRDGDRCTYGLTEFDHGLITIGEAEASEPGWGHDALAHELAHVAEAANTGHVAGHCRWSDPSFRAALAELSDQQDVSKPDPKLCP